MSVREQELDDVAVLEVAQNGQVVELNGTFGDTYEFLSNKLLIGQYNGAS
jgi:hypothetical protein